jgi:tRNA(fMet)-specific endonuclease VapC
MSLFVLDTDSLSLLEQGHPVLSAKVRALQPGELAITVITVDEQISGRYAQLRRARRPDEVARAYDLLALTVQRLGSVQILPFTIAAIARFQQLVSLRLNVGKNDLRIAAVALEHGATVVTRNLRDFQRVPNLTVEDWAV